MTCEKKSPHRLKNWYPPSTVSQVRRYVPQVPRISWSHWCEGTTWKEDTKGKERSSRSHGTTGKSGKSGMTGRTRSKGEKRDKGGTWPKGMPGATGVPGKTDKTGPKKSRGERKILENPGQKVCQDQLRALGNRYLLMWPADQTRDEGHNMPF